uniref:Uncharacterized protein n=1 Tax=Solanum tuberosum TaxID=4113 RepID=M1CNA9_SOLTU
MKLVIRLCIRTRHLFLRGFIKFRTLDPWLEKQHTREKSGIVGYLGLDGSTQPITTD